jgi:hypothetical protein
VAILTGAYRRILLLQCPVALVLILVRNRLLHPSRSAKLTQQGGGFVAGYLEVEGRPIEDEGRKHRTGCQDFCHHLSYPHRQHHAQPDCHARQISKADLVQYHP